MNKILKYGDSTNYQYKLDDDKLKWITDKTNRSTHQTQFLFNLVEGDFEKLIALELQIKNCFVHYCPDCEEELEHIMNMITVSDHFKF